MMGLSQAEVFGEDSATLTTRSSREAIKILAPLGHAQSVFEVWQSNCNEDDPELKGEDSSN